MSCLHAAAVHATTRITSACMSDLRRNFRHSHWMEAIEKLSRRVAIEPRICGLDAQEESIHRCTYECRRIEHRVVRLGKAVQQPHAYKRRQRRAKNSGFESDRDEIRPAMKRPATDIQRVCDRHRPVLQAVHPKTPQNT